MAKKRKASRTHKQRAVDFLIAYGWLVADVEAFVPRGKGEFMLRRDMWNLFDLLAINPRDPLGTLALQVTSANQAGSGHVATHLKKMLAAPQEKALSWALAVGWRVELWGVRDRPVDGSPVLARTFWRNDDGTIAVCEGSSVLEKKPCP